MTNTSCKTHERFVADLTAKNPNVEVLGCYVGALRHIEVRCRTCGHVWKPIAGNLLHGSGCPTCAHGKLANSIRKSHDRFVADLAAKNPNVEVIARYEGSAKRVKVRCRECGHVWEPVASSVLYGSGCPECKRHKISASRRKTHEQFVADLAAKNPNVEVLGRYEGARHRIKVRCRRCGHVWTPVAGSVHNGSGCPKCYGRKISSL